jgi:hypothetical protein
MNNSEIQATLTHKTEDEDKKNIKQKLKAMHILFTKYIIIGDKTLGEYNLHISDITEGDLGSYWCERFVNDVVIEKQVVIQLTGK